jgi:hypothetical protein
MKLDTRGAIFKRMARRIATVRQIFCAKIFVSRAQHHLPIFGFFANF